MQLIETIADMHSATASWHAQRRHVGFVPTMGNLHEGHLSLVKKAKTISEQVIVSIFVNPLQFHEQDDFASYPRTLQDDLQKLAELDVDAVFVPAESEFYSHERGAVTRVEVPGLSDILEGASRPGHFCGVATVVSKLFNCVQPDSALFGEKDFQQLLVIKQMVDDLNFPVTIIAMPTTREADGLAMSSRNGHLNTEERAIAPKLFRALQRVKAQILDANRDYAALEQQAQAELQQASFVPDYIAVRDATNLALPAEATKSLVILAAARLGTTRLIDNLRV